MFCLIVASRVLHYKLHPTYRYAPATMDQEKTMAQQTVAKWQDYKYIPIQDSAAFKNSLDKLTTHLEANPIMSAAMADKLIDTVRGFIYAFSIGNYESYKDFRFPPGFKYNITPAGTNRINDYFVNLPPLRPVSYEFYDYWHVQYKTNWHPRNMPNWHSQYETNWPEYKTNRFHVPVDINEKFQRFFYDYSGRNCYSNYFSAVCFDNLIVKIDRYEHTVPRLKECQFSLTDGAMGFSFATTNFPNLVYCDLGESRFRLFDIHPTTQDILTEEKSVLCANCLIFVQIHCPEEIYKPFLVRFYWVSKPQKWLVDDVIDANFFTATNSNYLIVF